nr:Ig-like domain-containing protein [Hymenobacter gummosus]
MNPTCDGSANGSATVVMSGGTPPYTYDWSPGNPTGDGTNSIRNLGGSFSNYSVLVRDAKNCTATYNFTLVTPSAINVNLTTNNPSTPGGADGTASVSLSGGTPPYYPYQWTRTSAPTGTLSANSTSTTSSVTGLVAGSYTVQATDNNGCPVSRSFTILDPTAAPVLLTPANGAGLTTPAPTYAGTAPAGSTVTLYVDGSSTGSTTADAGGNWSLTQPTALAFGAHTASARAQLSGNALSAPSATNTFTVLNPATYTSSTAEQPNTDRVVAGRASQEILRVAVTIGGGPDLPLSLQALTLATTGSTNASGSLAAARVYYTGSSSSFGAAVPFGTAVSRPNGAFTVTGSQPLSAGTNYFWLVYDVDAGATAGQLIDAELTSLTVSGTAYVPSVTSPGGSRAIVNTDPVAGLALHGTGGTTAGYVNFSATP